MAVQTQLQLRRGTASGWTSTNPVLAAGEIGFESDTGKIKIGNGSSTWTGLSYNAGAGSTTYIYNPSSSQTTFSGADANGLTLSYVVGNEQVYVNGVLLVRGTDYTASNTTSVVLTVAAISGDVVTILAVSSYAVTDAIAKTTLTAKGDLVTASAAGTPAVVNVGADGTTLVANSSASTGVSWATPVASLANPVINGGFDIWQRGTSINSSTDQYTADRWYLRMGASCTIARYATSDTTNLPNIQYCARVQRNSGSTSTTNVVFSQPMESVNSIPFAGKTVTYSFYARKGANFSEAASKINVYLISGTGTDQNYASGYTGTAFPIASSATLTATWQRFTYTGTVAATATELTAYVDFTPVGTALGNDYFEITGVQIDLGTYNATTAPAFRRSGGTFQGEFAACQRYYFREGYVGSGYEPFASGMCFSTTQALIASRLPFQMRNSPAVTYSSTASNFAVRSSSNTLIALTAIALDSYSPWEIFHKITVASGLTAGNATLLNVNGTNNPCYIEYNSEL